MVSKKYVLNILFITATFTGCNNLFNADIIIDAKQSIQETSLETYKKIYISSLHDFRKNLLSVLDELYKQLDYWQKAQYRPFGYFFEKGPYRWFFGKKQKTEMQHAIDLLNYEIIRNAHYLGQIDELSHQVESIPNSDLLQHIENSASNVQNMLKFVDIDKSMNISKTEDLDILLLKNQKAIQHYKKNAAEFYKKAQMPGHFTRHWIGYSISSICALVGLGYYLKNKDNISQGIKDSQNAIINFYKDYIATPVKNSFEIIYSKKENIPLTGVRPDDIKIEKEVLRRELISYCNDGKNKKYHEKYTQKEITDFINKFVETNSVESNPLIQDIMYDYAQQAHNPSWNAIWGQFIRLALITKIQPLIIKGKEIGLLSDHLYKSNKLNFELLVALPATALAGLACYLSYKGLKSFYHLFFPKKELLYKPIKQALITIETILNTHIQEPLSYAVNGQLLYWHHKLSQAINIIPFESRVKFARDLGDFENRKFTIYQKLNTVQRMFRTYDFLK